MLDGWGSEADITENLTRFHFFEGIPLGAGALIAFGKTFIGLAYFLLFVKELSGKKFCRDDYQEHGRGTLSLSKIIMLNHF